MWDRAEPSALRNRMPQRRRGDFQALMTAAMLWTDESGSRAQSCIDSLR
jgi:hypothetical protein